MERYTFLFLKGPLLTFSFLFLFFCFFRHSLKYHFVSVISIVQTSVYTADGCCGSTCLFGNIKICSLIFEHLCYLKTL